MPGRGPASILGAQPPTTGGPMFARTLLASAMLAVSLPALADRDDDREGREHAKARSFDPVYNVCRGPDPLCYNDWGVQQRKANRVLIYSRSAGPRHANLGPPLASGLNPALGADNIMQANLV